MNMDDMPPEVKEEMKWAVLSLVNDVDTTVEFEGELSLKAVSYKKKIDDLQERHSALKKESEEVLKEGILEVNKLRLEAAKHTGINPMVPFEFNDDITSIKYSAEVAKAMAKRDLGDSMKEARDALQSEGTEVPLSVTGEDKAVNTVVDFGAMLKSRSQ